MPRRPKRGDDKKRTPPAPKKQVYDGDDGGIIEPKF
jgi:hypothetical protein